MEQLNIARTTSDEGQKQDIIEKVRKNVCNKKERKVCCDNNSVPDMLTIDINVTSTDLSSYL